MEGARTQRLLGCPERIPPPRGPHHGQPLQTHARGFQSGGVGPGAGAAAYKQFCAECHGENMQNPKDDAPNLAGVTDRFSEDVIAATVMGGYGNMRAVPNIIYVELTAILGYLANPGGGGRGGGRGGPAPVAFPPGPVVASGGVAPPQAIPFGAPQTGPRYPGNGGNGGTLM